MFSKKKKGDAKSDAAAAPAAEAAPAASPGAAASEAVNPAPAPAPAAENADGEGPKSGGLASGLAGKAKSSGISASRLGGRPPSRPSAPAPEPSAAPPPPPPAPAAPPSPTSSGSGMGGLGSSIPPGASEADLSQSARNKAMSHSHAGMPQAVSLEEAGPDGAVKVKNPYKLNPLFDIILPFGMAIVLCGGFAATLKIVKFKHDIYGFTQEEQMVQVRDKALAAAAIMDEVRKMEPVKLMDANDSAGALAAAKPMGAAALALANTKGMATLKSADAPPPTPKELAEEGKTVRELCASGMVLNQLGAKADRELGLSYLAKAVEIATYSKYIRLMYARELVRAHSDAEAITQYETIVKLFLDPWPVPHKELGLLYMRNNKGAEAVEQLSGVMKMDPNDCSIQRQLGLAMAQNGDQSAGFEEFQKGFTREGDVLSYPAAVKGLVDAHGGLVDATLADVKKQAEKNPDDVKLQLDLARLEIATGKIKDARDLMDKARKTYETNPEVHEVMAEIMCRQNQAQSGYDEFRSAVQNLHLQ